MRRFILMALIIVPVALWAHTPLLVVEDNEDGTIYIEAGFSNGASAAGTDIIIRSKATEEILWQGKMGEDGMDVEMPGEPYTVTLDAGPGHIVTKEGPEPAGGFGAASDDATGSEAAATTAPQKSGTEPAAPGAAIAWTPAATMGAIPPSPPTLIEILMVIIGALHVLVLGYIAILIKRSKA
jgi:hypothetical protein